MGEVTVRAYEGGSAAASMTVQVFDCAKLDPVKLVMSSGGGVAGVALRQDGTPISKARLSLTARSIGVVNTISDEDGRFRFDEIPASPVRLDLRHEGRSTQLVVDVTDGEVTNQDITLSGDGTAELRGRVTASGKPLAGVQLVVAGNHGRKRGLGLYHPVTDAEGNYRVPSIQEGNYIVAVLSTNRGESVRLKDGEVVTMNINVAPAAGTHKED